MFSLETVNVMEILSIIIACIITAAITYFFVAYTVWWLCGVAEFWKNLFEHFFRRHSP